ncbi:Type 1 glutamine amidotransferase-like domain-containing protein [Paenibacillus alkalitolerans]|uniref:Type 1 glutamine amidotransferase-like domain-containing protein n=1 Tax=Paenibacillus alkalitolerans TaxID=2799335 RepID=UPI0018F4CC9C|nr:Type 1 glutamine amidotransferase-like domain-containing protein [Paenibacillus alkalitolerans]
MSKILLTSDGFTTSKIKEEFLNLIDLHPCNMNAAIITTAHRLKEQAPVSVRAQQALESMGFREAGFLDIEFDDADILHKYDVICLNGGNPFYLLHHLRLSGADKIIAELSEKGVTLVGISAGTMVLGPDIEIVVHFTPEFNNIGLNDMSALGLNKAIIFPHYGTVNKFPHEKSHETRIQEFEALHQCEVLRLTDYEAVYINGDTFKKITND